MSNKHMASSLPLFRQRCKVHDVKTLLGQLRDHTDYRDNRQLLVLQLLTTLAERLPDGPEVRQEGTDSNR